MITTTTVPRLFDLHWQYRLKKTMESLHRFATTLDHTDNNARHHNYGRTNIVPIAGSVKAVRDY
jgi:hypothetical protein